ncbi:MAG: hypothetical protein BGN88_03180 [Clostridiales bacterium 43-6]|nr:MAG: hypothetical protein BGN88_03180 [Clostridiales bacterium 43-6]
MLCKNCGKNIATTHIKHTIGGKTEELHLCANCAAELGITAFQSFDISDLWGSLFGDNTAKVQARTNEARCEGCNLTFSEIAKSGKAGCPQCYARFYDKLLPSLQRIHGKSQHVGKIPGPAGEKAMKANHIKSLKEELAAAVKDQNFERAAELRDEINTLEKGDPSNE